MITKNPNQPFMVQVVLMLTMTLMLFTPACTTMKMNVDALPKTPVVINWDLSSSQKKKQVDWDGSNTTGAMYLRNVTANITLQNRPKIENWAAENLYVWATYGGRDLIESIVVQTGALNLDEAYAEGLRIAKIYGMAEEPIHTWYAARKSEAVASTTQHFATWTSDEVEPLVSLESISSGTISTNPEDKLWSISLQVSWLSNR